MPMIGCIPKSFGTWTVKGAAEFLFLGETLKPLNDNNVFKPIGRIGISAAKSSLSSMEPILPTSRKSGSLPALTV